MAIARLRIRLTMLAIYAIGSVPMKTLHDEVTE